MRHSLVRHPQFPQPAFKDRSSFPAFRLLLLPSKTKAWQENSFRSYFDWVKTTQPTPPNQLHPTNSPSDSPNPQNHPRCSKNHPNHPLFLAFYYAEGFKNHEKWQQNHRKNRVKHHKNHRPQEKPYKTPPKILQISANQVSSHLDLPIETSRSHQGLVQNVGAVRGCDHHHALGDGVGIWKCRRVS